MKMAVDSLFNRLGQRAKYQNKDVLILVFAADDVGEVGFMNTASCPQQLSKSEWKMLPIWRWVIALKLKMLVII